MANKFKNEREQNEALKNDEAVQRKNALKLIAFVFVIPAVVIAISLATR